jgi:hypothetical protein
MSKDFFSGHSKAYATFRPTYPAELYAFIFKHLKGKSAAWDCATGNGQVARSLASHFDSVFASDISAKQIAEAFQAENIHYSICPAEKSLYHDQQFDLITVAQALHWLDVSLFYEEVNRTAKPGALLAVWGYSLPSFDPEVDEMLSDFYDDKVGPYWDAARRLVENHYRDIPFPFDTIACPAFQITVDWTVDQFAGYLTSWSATQNYIRSRGVDPVEEMRNALHSIWKHDDVKSGRFPIFMKLGKIQKLKLRNFTCIL